MGIGGARKGIVMDVPYTTTWDAPTDYRVGYHNYATPKHTFVEIAFTPPKRMTLHLDYSSAGIARFIDNRGASFKAELKQGDTVLETQTIWSDMAATSGWDTSPSKRPNPVDFITLLRSNTEYKIVISRESSNGSAAIRFTGGATAFVITGTTC